MARARKKSRIVAIDMTDVESGGGGGFKIPEGDYRMAVESVEDTESNAGNAMFKWTFVGKEGKAKGKKFYFYTVYDPPESLWKLRQLLEALNVDVPDDLQLDLDELVDLEITGIVSNEEYDGKITSKMNDFSPVDGEEEEEEKPVRGKKKKVVEEDEEEDEKPARGKKKAKKDKALDAIGAEEVKAMDDDEMADLVERYELDVELKEHKTPRRKASAIIAALEEKELLADD